MRKFTFLLASVMLSFFVCQVSQADSYNPEPKREKPFEAVGLPQVLKDWVKWTLDGREKSGCDFSYNNFNEKYCYYISNLGIDINGKDVSFTQNVKILEKGYVLLPGSLEVFPSEVLVNGKKINIISRNGRPYINLDEGTYAIKGKSRSKEEVRYLFIPDNAAVINVKKAGISIINPTIDESGVLRMETKSTSKSETDDISVFAYRKINDNVPVQMTLRLNLNVTGKERVENLGKVIPGNFSLMSMNSSISAYIQKNGELVAEVKPGYSTIDVVMRQNNESLDFVLDNTPVEQEIWVFESDKSRRVIQAPLSLHSVQAQNIPMPDHWKRLPAYEINKGDKFTLKAIAYDNKNLDVLSLNRNIKLSFDGSFYSIQDNINADFKEDGRLLLRPPFKFYSANINGEPQAITYTSEDKDAGIEVRKGNAGIENVLRVNNDSSIPAAGYNRDFKEVTWNLTLAPGYKLFYAAGVDTVSNSWVSNWNLLGVFIVALLTACFYYLFGFKKAVLGLFLLTLLHPVFPQFTTISFVLCGLLFLQRNIKPEQMMYSFVAYIRYTLFLFLLAASFVFTIKHLRGAIYPALDTETQSFYMFFINLQFLFYFYIYSFVGYLIYRIFANAGYEGWRKGLYTFGIVILTIIGTSISAAALNGFMLIGSAPRYALETGGHYDTFGMADEVMVAQEIAVYDDYKAEFRNSAKLKSVSRNVVMTNKMLEKDAMLKQKYQSINVAKNIAQTGVGFPSWQEYRNSISLYLKGPVTNEDAFRLYLLSPVMNIILAFIRVILGIFVLLWLFDGKKTSVKLGEKGKDIMKRLFAASVFGLILLNPLTAKAEEIIPPSEVIKKMEEKLTRENIPSCLPECVSIPDGKISSSGDDVKIGINFHTNEKLVVPMPILRADGSGFAKLESISVNGAKATEILRKGDNIYALLNKGINNVEMNYSLDENSDRFILSSQIRINYMESSMQDLSFSENKSNNQTFQINRMKKVAGARKTSELSKMDIDTFFVVGRNFDINTMWQVTTTVSRQNNLSEASIIEVPLLEGEKVIDTDGTLLKDKIRISFSPRETEKTFESILPVEQDIKLSSPKKIVNYKEEWTFNVDYTWSFKYSGMKAVVSDTTLSFKPDAGEKLYFKVFRPENVDGYVITFDKVNYDIFYGRGVLEAKIALDIRASDAGVHDITIPKNAEVKELFVDGRQYPVTVNGGKLTIPVVQGNNKISFTAMIKNKLGTIVKFPKFDLNAPAVNITQTAQVPLSRWVLFTSGPVKGPAVLFWSMMPAWLIIAFVLSRFKAAPVTFAQWFILLLGLTQTSFFNMIIIITWFMVVGIRDRFSDKLKFKKLFQICIPVLTLMFMYSLFNGIYSGLLGSWSMRIVGGESYTYSTYLQLKWYQDAIMGALPSPKILSLPVWVYRCFMIIWSTWLAIYFVKWVKWGFKAYVKDEAWK